MDRRSFLKSATATGRVFGTCKATAHADVPADDELVQEGRRARLSFGELEMRESYGCPSCRPRRERAVETASAPGLPQFSRT
jgi:hypothetical protein